MTTETSKPAVKLRVVTSLTLKDLERLDRMAQAERRDRSAQVAIAIQQMLNDWEFMGGGKG